MYAAIQMAPPSASTRSATNRSAVAIVGSAGGIPALLELLAVLPATFPFPIVISQHLSRAAPSVLPAILAYRTRLPVKWAEQEERLRGGIAYIVPPGSQLSIRAGGFAISALSPFARSWLVCPDVLLRSLAEGYGAGAVGIVLSGTIAVGIDGLRAIRRGGGIAIAQSERSASFSDMPVGAIDLGKAELVLSPARIAEALIVLAAEREAA